MLKIGDNNYKILEILANEKKSTAVYLSERLGVTAAAVSKNLKKLKEEGMILEIEEIENIGKGRPRKIVIINPNFKKILAVSFETDYFEIAVCKLDGSIVEKRRKNFYMKKQSSLLNLLIDELKVDINRVGHSNIVGIGIAIPGMVDSKQGRVIYSPSLKWKNLELEKIVRTELKIPIIIENSNRAKLNAELEFEYLKKEKNILYLSINQELSMSFKINNEIFTGSNMKAGEFGHYIYNRYSNFTCKCGKSGCINTEFSENIIKLLLPEFEDLSITEIYALAKKESAINKLLVEKSRKLGEIVANILIVLDISTIVIEGNILKSEGVFTKNFERAIKETIHEFYRDRYRVYETKLNGDATIKGATSLVTSNLFVNRKLYFLK